MTVGLELLDDARHHVDRASTKNDAAGSLSDGLDELQAGTHHGTVHMQRSDELSGQAGLELRGVVKPLDLRFF